MDRLDLDTKIMIANVSYKIFTVLDYGINFLQI